MSWIKLADYRHERRSFAVVAFKLFLTDGRHRVRPPQIPLTIPRFVVTVAFFYGRHLPTNGLSQMVVCGYTIKR